MPATKTCPACSYQIPIEADQLSGGSVACPGCGKRLSVKRRNAAASPDSKTVLPAVDSNSIVAADAEPPEQAETTQQWQEHLGAMTASAKALGKMAIGKIKQTVGGEHLSIERKYDNGIVVEPENNASEFEFAPDQSSSTSRLGLGAWLPQAMLTRLSNPWVAIGIPLVLTFIFYKLALATRFEFFLCFELAVIFGSAFLIYYDASANKIGQTVPTRYFRPNSFKSISPGGWALGTIVLWLIYLPWYLIRRPQLVAIAKTSPREARGMLWIRRILAASAILLVICAVIIGPSTTGQIEASAVPVVTKLIGQLRNGRGANCIAVKINQEITKGVYRATAFLDNGNDIRITIQHKDDQILVTMGVD